MKKSKLYQVFQKIENDIDNNADSGNVLKLFEVYNETVFWVEVEANESITSKLRYQFMRLKVRIDHFSMPI